MAGAGTVRIDVAVTPEALAAELGADARAGLLAPPRSMPPKWLYDERGSELFERITRLPEYYLTRAETAILEARAAEIAALTRAQTLVELGSGTSQKTRLLLDALSAQSSLRLFAPFDLSEPTLRAAADRLVAAYPSLAVHGVVADLERDLARLPPAAGEPRLVVFLGSTVGNLERPGRGRLLQGVAGALEAGGWLLLGSDLVKERARLEAAYDDAQGVTAAFNRNLLHVLDRELGAGFEPERFDHVARWNEAEERMELALRAASDMEVSLGRLGAVVALAAGEEIQTEISAKFRRAGVEAELAAAGFELVRWWTDTAGDFALSLARLRSRP